MLIRSAVSHAAPRLQRSAKMRRKRAERTPTRLRPSLFILEYYVYRVYADGEAAMPCRSALESWFSRRA